MKPSRHFIVSAFLAALMAAVARRPAASLLCFASGFLIDIDHIFEYIAHYGLRDFTIEKFLNACEETRKIKGDCGFRKIYLIFHGYEIAILLVLLCFYTQNIYLVAITLGYIPHLAMDAFGNTLTARSYFLTYRAMKNFKLEALLR